MLVRVQAGSEKAREPGYPWVLQTKKLLQHPKMLLPAQLLFVTPLLKAEEPVQIWKATRCLQINCCHSCLITLHKPPSAQNWGVIKSQKQVQQCSYPHFSGYLSCLLISHPEVMWVSALHRCVMDVPFWVPNACVIAGSGTTCPAKRRQGPDEDCWGGHS